MKLDAPFQESETRITEAGIEAAIQVLNTSGDIPQSGSNPTETCIRLIAACEKYLEASRAKGDSRSEQEERDGVLVCYFLYYLRETISTVN
jgi:hypothetical protein